MRFNDKELTEYANGTGDKEGRMYHKYIRDGYKERWFKLKGNLLFYYRVNEYGGIHSKEPVGLFVVEDCSIQTEDNSSLPFAFSITFTCDPRKHYFGCSNQVTCDDWVKLLKAASYQTLKRKLYDMQTRLLNMTGVDPLATFPHLLLQQTQSQSLPPQNLLSFD
jgi:hypothetical protein